MRLSLFIAVFCSTASCGSPSNMMALPPIACQSDDDCTTAPKFTCQSGSCVSSNCRAGSVYVPGGSYTRGCQATHPDCNSNAQPAHRVTLRQGFCLAETELTVADYRACLDTKRCMPPALPESLASLRCSASRATYTLDAQDHENLPMNCLLWTEAQAACTALGGRLPTEAEWERAARGRDERFFPWGNIPPIFCDQGTNFAGSDCIGKPWPVPPENRTGVMLDGPFGALDLSGNLSEWVADYFLEDAYAACASDCTDPLGPATGFLRVRRGGSFASPTSELRSYAREFHVPDGPRSDLIGVRCAFPSAF